MRIRRREFLAASFAFGAGVAAAQTPRRPNVLVLLSDQESQLADRNLLRLPNRERLEQRGVTFSHCYSTTPQCSPARAALWTGRYPHRTGVIANVGAAGASPLSPHIPGLGQVFQAAGYRTAYFGKWHLSEGGQGPAGYGFETAPEVRGDQQICGQAAQWIASQGAGPWLAVVSIIQPHDIYHFPRRLREARAENRTLPLREGIPAPPSGREDLRHRPAPQRLYTEHDQGQACVEYSPEDWRRYRTYYYELIEDADRNLGTVLDALERAGNTENSIVTYLSDHGDAQGAHGLAFKGPFLHEELSRVPLVVSWPAGLPQATTRSALVSQIDLLPTLCDLTQVDPPGGVDGRGLRAVLEDKTPEEPQEVFLEYHSKQSWANPIRGLRRGDWKLSVYLDGGRELYHLNRDPWEQRNLAGTAAAASQERDLLARLEEWAAETTDTLWFDQRGS